MRAGYWHRPRDTVEGLVAAQWRSVLARRPASIDVGFFAEGATPLDAGRLASRLSQVFHRDVPVRVVYDNPTIRHLAGWLKANGGRTEHRVRPLNVEGNAPPLVVIPGAIGTLASLGILGERDFDRPVFGVECHRLTGADPRFLRTPALAGDFANEVESSLPPQPVHLAGYCTGAVTAFELARELAGRRWPVRSLTMLSPSTLAVTHAGLSFDEFVDQRLAQLARFAGVAPEATTATEVDDRIHALYRQIRHSGLNVIEPDAADFAARVRTFATNSYAASRYVPRSPVPVPTVVLSTAGETSDRMVARWRPLLREHLDYEAFDEHHMDMLISDDVARAWAAKLRKIDTAGAPGVA